MTPSAAPGPCLSAATASASLDAKVSYTPACQLGLGLGLGLGIGIGLGLGLLLGVVHARLHEDPVGAITLTLTPNTYP